MSYFEIILKRTKVFTDYADKPYMMGQKTIFKLIITMLSVATLTSCMNKKNVYQIDPTLAPYHDLFLTVGKINGKDYSTNNLILEMADIDPVKYPDMVGYCTFYRDERLINPVTSEYIDVPRVSIDRRYFREATQEAKVNLIFHELGHCVLKRSHDESMGEYGYPKSLMYPFILYNEDSQGFFIELLSVYYYQELFQPQTPQVDPQTLASIHSGLASVDNEQLNEKLFMSNKLDNTNIIYATTKKGCGLILKQNNEQGDSNDTQ